MPNNELKSLKEDVSQIKNILTTKIPSHFSWEHLAASFIGALIMGQTFVLKGLVYDVSYKLTGFHIIAILLATFFVLTVEVYYIGYRRVLKKEKRRFGQFWFKRITTYFAVSFIVSFSLIFLYNMNTTFTHTLKIAIAICFPCAVGASLADLLEKY